MAAEEDEPNREYHYLYAFQPTAPPVRTCLTLEVLNERCIECGQAIIDHTTRVLYGCEHQAHDTCALRRVLNGVFPLRCGMCAGREEAAAVVKAPIEPTKVEEPPDDDSEAGIALTIDGTPGTREDEILFKKLGLHRLQLEVVPSIDYEVKKKLTNLEEWPKLKSVHFDRAYIENKGYTLSKLLKCGVTLKQIRYKLCFSTLSELVAAPLKLSEIHLKAKTVTFPELAVLFGVRYSDLKELGINSLHDLIAIGVTPQDLRFLGIGHTHQLIKRGLDLRLLQKFGWKPETWVKHLGMRQKDLDRMKFNGAWCIPLKWDPLVLADLTNMKDEDRDRYGINFRLIQETRRY